MSHWSWWNWSNWSNWSNFSSNPGQLVFNAVAEAVNGTEQTAAAPFGDVTYSHQQGWNYNGSYTYFDVQAYSFSVEVDDATAEDELALSLGSAWTVSGSQILRSGVVIATFSGGGDGAALAVTMEPAYRSSFDWMAELVEGVRWTNTSDTPPPYRDLHLTVTESDGVYSTDVVRVNLAAVNDEPTGTVSISGDAQEDAVLTASNDLADAEGLGDIAYQWLRDDEEIDGANESTYTLTQDDVGAQISVKASYTDDAGTPESKTSDPTAEIANVNDTPQGSVTITGTATQGQTLQASDDITDEDGLGTIAYQWLRDGEAIDGASGSQYTLTQDDVGAAISVKATYADDYEENESVTSGATGPVQNTNDAPTGGLTLSGEALQGTTLSFTSSVQDLDGLGDFSYAWLRGGVTIEDETGITYTLTQEDVGEVITLVVSYTDDFGAEESVSASTASVENANDAPTGTVTITGIAIEEGSLTASESLDDLDGLGEISFQWQADGEDIEGATGDTLLLDQEHIGKAITVVASYTDGFGQEESVASEATGDVQNVNDAPTGSVTISGTPRQLQTLTAVTSAIEDEDGLGTFSYQWLRNGVAINGAIGATYVLTGDDTDKYVSVRVTYTDGFGTAEMLVSEPTVLVGAHRIGSSGSDSLAGGLANDSLQGMGGHDTLKGGAGVDTMEGGTGNDMYFVDDVNDVVVESGLSDIKDSIFSSVTYTAPANVEHLTLTGSADIDGTGNGLNNVLTGNTGANVLTGFAGNDTLDGGAGNDTMRGGDGNDMYTVDSTYDVIEETGTGTADKVFSNTTYTLSANLELLTLTGTIAIDATGNDTANTITGNDAANRLDGAGGSDTLAGLNGDDTLVGGAGNDSMAGGAGNDTYHVTESGDKVTEGSGADIDTIVTWIDYVMPVYAEVLVLMEPAASGTGNAQNNLITGNTLANALSGAGGADTLQGGEGNDTLNGGAAGDVLEGGAGKDRFVYLNVSESQNGVGLRDSIIGFSTADGDLVDLKAIDANISVGGDQAFTFIGTNPFSANATAQLRFDPATGTLYASNDTDTIAELAIVLVGITAFAATSVVL